MFYSNCQCSSAFCLSMTFLFILFRIAGWPSAGKVLSSWLSALTVLIVCRLNCVPFPFGVQGSMWNSIVSVPGCCLFIFSPFYGSPLAMYSMSD